MNRRTVARKSRMPIRFSEAELVYITRYNEFDQLLRAAQATYTFYTIIEAVAILIITIIVKLIKM